MKNKINNTSFLSFCNTLYIHNKKNPIWGSVVDGRFQPER